ncbi:hypothetical protein O0555_18225 [Brevibacillus laterosporus]|uniref:hypothetical protein n=1 Tax=Brevibacillus laterosporus TaxID=1465 RepID=UPI00112BBBA2|nr:hypothetical protein [Brevibacillus laterosporus]MBG9774468.1 hypothetical protein [Brevibacillus laterosporus]MBG9801670.1 hypothetical protein [Brevibacillus laterosporus]MCR8939261.1 hypothetical protein [Brevibacillus laterosporus]MCZ0841901.1 hypothetical protein [Brevibacillus laterosporus]MCZ0846906.1 hypothetical protein [Brevibacillus laterosporus]
MILTDEEKDDITLLKTDDEVKFDDESRSVYQFEVEKVSTSEWRVTKNAIMCLKVEYFSKPIDVINFIESEKNIDFTH